MYCRHGSKIERMETGVTSSKDIFQSSGLKGPLNGGLGHIFNHLSNAILIVDQHFKMIYANLAFLEISGYPRDEVVGKDAKLFTENNQEHLYTYIKHSLSQTGQWEGEVCIECKVGTSCPVWLTISRIFTPQRTPLYIYIFSDISALVSDHEKKINFALHDPLTGIGNRILLEECFKALHKEALKEACAHENQASKIAFLFIDVNDFKKLNDSFGHLVGDEVLIFIAQTLAECARSRDIVSRFGGDEFVILLPNILDAQDVITYCLRVQRKLKQGRRVDGHFFRPEVSIGVSFYPNDETHFQQLLKQADRAMYRAKTKKKLIMFHNPKLNSKG